MAYTPQTWIDLPNQTTPLNAARLNTIEQGIAGLGVFSTFSPSISGITVGSGSSLGKISQIGKTVFLSYQFVFGAGSAVTGPIILTLPVTAFSANQPVSTSGFALDATPAAEYPLAIRMGSATTLSIGVINASGTYNVYNSISSTVPFTWTTSDRFNIGVVYEAA